MQLRKNIKQFCLIVSVSIFVLQLVGCVNSTKVLKSSKQPGSYPIDSTVLTTLERTVVPVPVPSNSPKLLPNEVSKYSQYGYGVWKADAGLSYQKRLDIMPPAYTGTSVTSNGSLLRFFTMSDMHITDKQSPAQAIYFGLQGQAFGMWSAYSPVILYTTQVLDAAVQTVNALNKKQAFDFGIFLGDAINNAQYNELRWYIDVLDGQIINPNSDPKAIASTDYLRRFKAAGLDKSIPWYQVLGNHDHFWSGVYPPNERIKKTLVSEFVLNIGNVLIDTNLDHRGFYTGVVDGSTRYGEVIYAGPEADFSTPPKVNANPDRHWISRNEWITEFFNTTSSPAGHGFTQDNAKAGFGCYTFEPKANLPLKVIVLDGTEKDDAVFGKGITGAFGSLDQERYEWLLSELDKGQSEGKLMVVASHIPLKVGIGDPASSPTEDVLIAKLHTYSNLILWVSGHRHYNTVMPMTSPDPTHPEFGFWQVETASLRDFPQQFRLFDIVRNSDNTISIFTTNVDPAVKQGSPAAISRSYAIAAYQIFPTDPNAPYRPSGAYNAELVKLLSIEMQAKIQNYGTPICE